MLLLRRNVLNSWGACMFYTSRTRPCVLHFRAACGMLVSDVQREKGLFMKKRMRIWREKWQVPAEVCEDATFKLARDGTPLAAWGCGGARWARNAETGAWDMVREHAGAPPPPERVRSVLGHIRPATPPPGKLARGVYFDDVERRWRAVGWLGGQLVPLGLFATQDAADDAYIEAQMRARVRSDLAAVP